jgi:hypothetical protein
MASTLLLQKLFFTFMTFLVRLGRRLIMPEIYNPEGAMLAVREHAISKQINPLAAEYYSYLTTLLAVAPHLVPSRTGLTAVEAREITAAGCAAWLYVAENRIPSICMPQSALTVALMAESPAMGAARARLLTVGYRLSKSMRAPNSCPSEVENPSGPVRGLELLDAQEQRVNGLFLSYIHDLFSGNVDKNLATKLGLTMELGNRMSAMTMKTLEARLRGCGLVFDYGRVLPGRVDLVKWTSSTLMQANGDVEIEADEAPDAELTEERGGDVL